MKVFILLQAAFLLPYFIVGVAWPFVLLDPDSRTHSRDLHHFSVWTGAGLAFWLPIAIAGRILSLREPTLEIAGSASWRVFFPATTRLFAIGAPATFVAGLAAGGLLWWMG